MTDTMPQPPERPVTFHGASGSGRTWLDARDRYDELTQRDLLARARATLVARGTYDPAVHGTAEHTPLSLAEHLEVLANGEVVARVYRHPVQVDRAVQAGASWEQIAAALGVTEAQARHGYREWAEGQYQLWRDYGGRFGLDEAAYAAAIARAEAGQPAALPPPVLAGLVTVSCWGDLPGEERLPRVLRVLVGGRHAGAVRRCEDGRWAAYPLTAAGGPELGAAPAFAHAAGAVRAVLSSPWAVRLGARLGGPLSWSDQARQAAERTGAAV
jgi:hypothetical protein